MFNKEFYPTPQHLIAELLSGCDIDRGITILEPSAGKGDIAKYVQERYNINVYYNREYPLDMDCIEINTDLQNVLKGAGFRVVHNDFLTYHTGKKYDLIIMNPPFSNGDAHLLKAIEMQERNGGKIRCILNAETIKNQCTYRRQILAQKLEELGADINYISNGFSQAERKTDVEIAIVKIDIPYKAPEYSIVFDNLKKQEAVRKAAEYKSEDLITNDFIKGIVQQYNFEIELGLKLIDECAYVNSKLLRSFDEENTRSQENIMCLTFTGYNSRHYADSVTPNEFIKAVREKYWKALFKNPQFTGLMTSNLQTEFQNKINELVDYDFSEYNIYTIKLEMMNNMVSSVDDTILALFEEYSNKYHWFDECSKNVHYYNGWKTNKAYKVGKKVIVPYDIHITSNYRYEGYQRINYKCIGGQVQKLIDTEKVFNYLDGGLTDFKCIKDVLDEAATNGQTSKIECKYFYLTFYKKGTCHITFKDEKLLKKFNLFGSQRKGWLPPCYGKKVYQDMTEEEKSVIDEFEGEKSYAETLSNQDYYIQDTRTVLMIEGGNND